MRAAPRQRRPGGGLLHGQGRHGIYEGRGGHSGGKDSQYGLVPAGGGEPEQRRAGLL